MHVRGSGSGTLRSGRRRVSTLLTPLLGLAPATRAILQLTVLAGVPVAFALGLLRGGLARPGELEELGPRLGTTGARSRRPAS